MSDIKQAEELMIQAIEHFKKELNNIRTGRANPAILDSVKVEAYGTQMALRDLANVTSPEPRQLLITPYDASTTGAIGKAIEKANLGFRPIVDANAVRIQIPPMDESVRKEMVKVCGKFQEEAKISIRNARRDFIDTIRKQKSDGDLPEDLMKKFEKQIQELTDKYCQKVDELNKEKVQEIQTI